MSKSNGALLSYQDLYAIFELDQSVSVDMILTQQDHPILNRPFFYLHPCKTHEWMKQTEIEDPNQNKYSF